MFSSNNNLLIYLILNMVINPKLWVYIFSEKSPNQNHLYSLFIIPIMNLYIKSYTKKYAKLHAIYINESGLCSNILDQLLYLSNTFCGTFLAECFPRYFFN